MKPAIAIPFVFCGGVGWNPDICCSYRVESLAKSLAGSEKKLFGNVSNRARYSKAPALQISCGKDQDERGGD
jgi:hypothetical protein